MHYNKDNDSVISIRHSDRKSEHNQNEDGFIVVWEVQKVSTAVCIKHIEIFYLDVGKIQMTMY